MKDQKPIGVIIRDFKSDQLSQAEQQRMFALFHHSEKEFELKNCLLDDLYATAVPDDSSFNLKKAFARLKAAIEKTDSSQKTGLKAIFLTPFMRVAAALFTGLIVGALVYALFMRNEPVYYTTHSPRGSVSELQLPDGSNIFLNSGSKIKYSVEGNKRLREVFLEGEAWFDVGKNEKKPFVVHTPFYDVKVTGTQFNVKAYPEDHFITTTLESGEVIIKPSGDRFIFKEVLLKPGQQMVFDSNAKSIDIDQVSTSWFTSWKDNKLIFVNMSFKELITVLERKYGVDIEVENTQILDYHFDGTIKNETIFEILEIIKKTLPIKYEIIDQTIKITDK